MKTKSIKNIFVFSARRVLLALLLMFLGVVVLSSCQIEKRQYMKGFFFGKPGTSKVVQNDSNHIAEHFANIADTINVAVVPETHQEKFPAEGHTNESVSAGHLLKEKEQNKIIKSTGPAFSSEYKYFLPRKTSLLKAIPATWALKKLHPLAIWAFFMIAMGFLALILGVYFEASALAFVFLGLLVAAWVFLLLAIIKTKENPQQWNGLIVENIILVMLSIVVFCFLLGMALLTL